MLTLVRCLLVDPIETHRGSLRRIVFITRGAIFAGLENGDDPDKIPVGEYPLQMATMATSKMRALWVPNTKLFIHPANFPDQLEGCAAPGLATDYGVEDSGATVERFIRANGGFKEKREVPFECIETNAPDFKNLSDVVSAWQNAPLRTPTV